MTVLTTSEVGTPAVSGMGGLLVRWHLLSLDAPCVAGVWTWFFGRVSHRHVPAETLVAMVLAVWILYVVDRLLDFRLGASRLEERHLFHGRNWRGLLGTVVAASAVLVGLVVRMPRRQILLYLALGAALLAWFSVIHGLAPARHEQLRKEWAVGLFFSLAVVIPAFAAGFRPDPKAAAMSVLLAGLCTLNCFFIAAWEDRTGAGHHGMRKAAAGLLVCCGGGLLLSGGLWCLAVGVAAGALLCLDQFGDKLQPLTRRAAADAALLTPLLVWPWLR